MHLVGHKLDHDYYLELLREEERAAHSMSRCCTGHHGLLRARPRVSPNVQDRRSLAFEQQFFTLFRDDRAFPNKDKIGWTGQRDEYQGE